MPFVACFLLLLAAARAILALGGQGLVNPQSACNIRCENGGMCAFSFDNPQFHTCICLMGVYEGERCQYEVGLPRTNPQKTWQKQPPSLSAPPSGVVNSAKMHEMERERDDQRRRHYEMNAEKRKAEQQRQIEVPPARVGNTLEESRIEELRRRDEELRRIAAKRREEERRREEEEGRREDERRRVFGRREEERVREEQQRQLEQQRATEKEENSRMVEKELNGEEATTSENETSDGDFIPQATEYDYKSDEEDSPGSNDDYLHGSKEAERVEGDDEAESNDPATVSDVEPEQSMAREAGKTSQSESLREITTIIEAAATETLKHHDVEDEPSTSPAFPEDDDYWDHSIKRDDEDYEASRVADSEIEETFMSTKTTTTTAEASTDVREFTAEEGEEGWMMMKRVDENLSSIVTSTVVTALALLMRIW